MKRDIIYATTVGLICGLVVFLVLVTGSGRGPKLHRVQIIDNDETRDYSLVEDMETGERFILHEIRGDPGEIFLTQQD